MPVRILGVSSSRADASILSPVWQVLAARPEIELHVLATGMHMAAGAMPPQIPAGAICHHGGGDLGGRSGDAAARAMIACASATSDLLVRIAFDCLLVMGDRLDMLPAAFAAAPHNIPIAHVHGGELTYGAIDERVRHALTKLAHLHFVSSRAAAGRLARMGEEPWRIHVTGGPGLDALGQSASLTAAAFAEALRLPFTEGFVLATVHPETNSTEPAAPMRAVLAALDRCGAPTLITAPNSDPAGRELRDLIDRFLSGKANAAFRDTLGPVLYPNALRHSAVMLGNSSSGLIEAGFFGLPVINVGGRQEGRESGPNVCHVPSDAGAVLSALKPILAERPRLPRSSPYGDGAASERIAAVLADLPERAVLLRKIFHDGAETPLFAVPWEEPMIANALIPADIAHNPAKRSAT